jgi:hypothetical protein
VQAFVYPGVLAMSALFTVIFPATSIVRDREFWFLREMLVTPVSRSAIDIGKCLATRRFKRSRQSLTSLWLAWRMPPMTPLRY